MIINTGIMQKNMENDTLIPWGVAVVVVFIVYLGYKYTMKLREEGKI